MNKIPYVIIFLLFAALAIVGGADMEAEQAEAREYCELVALWQATPDGYVGIPPYRTDIDCNEVLGQ